MIYVVLGMHKSGTTLVAEMLHKSGINMGDFDECVDYDSGNRFERQETRDLNIAMLGSGDNHSLNLITPVKSDALGKNFEKKRKELIARLDATFNDWGFKDPRTCLTFEAWEANLPEHRIIFVYRSPLEVCLHYEKVNLPVRLIWRLRVAWKAIIAWYNYNNQAIKCLDKQENEAIMVNYSKLMQGETEFRRLEAFLGFKLHDCRKKNWYRCRYRKNRLYDLISWVQARYFSRNVTHLFDQIEKRRQDN